mgnify:CR=1 FL=1
MSKAPAVDYALRIIEFFSIVQKEVGIADICNSLEINKNAASRVLEALVEYNWIYQSDPIQKKYSFTLKPFSVVSKCTPRYPLTEVAKGELKKLNEELSDSVYLGVRNGDKVLYLLHFDSKREVRINGRVGGEYPLETAAPGKILLAYTEYLPKFNDEAERIKKRGYATDNEEFAKGIVCVACPIYDADSSVIAAVGISSLTIYDDIESLTKLKLPKLRKAAENISEKLGYRGNDYVL